MKWLIGKNSTFNFTSNHNRNFCAKSSSLNLHYFYVWSLFQKNVMANVFLSLTRLCDPPRNVLCFRIRKWRSLTFTNVGIPILWCAQFLAKIFFNWIPLVHPKQDGISRDLLPKIQKKTRNRKKKKQLNVTLKKDNYTQADPSYFQ